MMIREGRNPNIEKAFTIIKKYGIGLTGGIATGKSTVGNILSQFGFIVIDADKLSQETVIPGSEGLQKITNIVGTHIINTDGTLNRKKLAEIMFNNTELKIKIENILHPLIHKLLFKEMEKFYLTERPRPWFYEASLIIENGFYKKFQQIWVTYCPYEEQIRRLIQIKKIPYDLALKIIQNQMNAFEKTKFADVIINTNCTIEELKQKIKLLTEKLR